MTVYPYPPSLVGVASTQAVSFDPERLGLRAASGSLNRLARTSVTQPFNSASRISNSGTWSVGSASPGKIKHAKLFGTNVS